MTSDLASSGHSAQAPSQAPYEAQSKAPALPSAVRPAPTELLGLAFVAWLAFMLPLLVPETYFSGLNIALTAAMSAILVSGCLTMLRRNSFAVMSALFWFRAAVITYFGFGTAYVSIIDGEVLTYVQAFHPFTMPEVLELNQLIITCVTVTLGTVYLVEPRQGAYYLRAPRISGQGSALRVTGTVFFGIGVAAYFLGVLPWELGLSGSPPNAIITRVAPLRLLGLFLLTLWALRHKQSSAVLALAGYTGIEVILGFVNLTKSAVLLSMLIFLLPFLIQRPSITRFALIGALLATVFLAIQSVLGDLRNTYADETQQGFGTRLQVIDAVVFDDTGGLQRRTALSSLSRLSFVNAATLLMDQYDRGFPSDWPKLIPAVFVPRMLWPDKPIISDVGVQIYGLGTNGRDTSAFSAGYYAESYWAGGWTLSLILASFLGLVLWASTRFALRMFWSGRWIQLLTVFMMMRIGFRVDGHYLVDVFGNLVYVLAFWLFFSGVESAIHTWRSGRGVATQQPLPRMRA